MDLIEGDVQKHFQYVRELLQDSGAEVAHHLHPGGAGDLPCRGDDSDPGLDGAALQKYFDESAANQGGEWLLGMQTACSRAARSSDAPSARRHHAYISATIIIQLLTAVVPRLSKLAREEGAGPSLSNTAVT